MIGVPGATPVNTSVGTRGTSATGGSGSGSGSAETLSEDISRETYKLYLRSREKRIPRSIPAAAARHSSSVSTASNSPSLSSWRSLL